jgi:predicted deacylase
MGERIARRIFDLILETGPSLVIDIHNDWIQSVPYVVLEPRSHFRNAAQFRRVVRNAAATNLLLVEESDSNEPLSNTLSGAMVDNGIPAFTIEAGGACGIVERSIKSGKAAILGVLNTLGMTNEGLLGDIRRQHAATVYAYTNRPLCTSAGIIRFSVSPGESLKASQELGRVFGAFGSVEEILHAARPGYVLGVSDHARALPGSEVIAIAEFDVTQSGREERTGQPGRTSIH